jgi:hypothetical protein
MLLKKKPLDMYIYNFFFNKTYKGFVNLMIHDMILKN